jgi:hypothetical protein
VPQSLDNRPRLRPPQFGLRTLLVVVTICAVLLAIARLGVLSPIELGIIGFLALSIFAHVAGNAIGTRLRAIGDVREACPPDDSPEPCRPIEKADFAPATRLGERSTLGWSIIIATNVGLAAGAIGGGLWTFLFSRGQPDPVAISIGVVAFGILGAFGAFAIVSFTQVLAGAIWQALQGSAVSTSRSTTESV